jgi:hypothetical protein
MSIDDGLGREVGAHGVDHRAHDLAVGQHGDDDGGVAHGGREVAPGLAALDLAGEALARRRGGVVADDAVAGLRQARRHGDAHVAEADERDPRRRPDRGLTHSPSP